MNIFRRFFRVAESKTHAAIDHLEDPVIMTEQGIRDLRKELDVSIRNLAEARAVLIRLRREYEEKQQIAASYENKAVLLLKKARAGNLDTAEADRLASTALSRKEDIQTENLALSQRLSREENQANQLETNIQNLKTSITKWEHELLSLKARAKVAQTSRRLNEQLAQVDSSGTIAMLEKMKQKVAEDEALAESYARMSSLPSSLDDEIHQALEESRSGAATRISTSDSLAALKARLNKEAHSSETAEH
ncbi:MAG: PspA/IM30 family protein [Deltaproteobacteria bacterium]|nr:PspA/IM30 family protein [Deltaproteobacteria bacterium]